MTREGSAAPLALAVQAMRKDRYGTLDRMATAYGTTRQTIINWENGTHTPTAYRDRLIGDGVPAELFIDEKALASRIRELERQATDVLKQTQEARQLLEALVEQGRDGARRR